MNDKLKAVLEKALGEDSATFESVKNFRDADFWDSLRYVNLVVTLQSEFKIQLKKEDMQRLFSVADIQDVLAGYGIKA